MRFHPKMCLCLFRSLQTPHVGKAVWVGGQETKKMPAESGSFVRKVTHQQQWLAVHLTVHCIVMHQSALVLSKSCTQRSCCDCAALKPCAFFMSENPLIYCSVLVNECNVHVWIFNTSLPHLKWTMPSRTLLPHKTGIDVRISLLCTLMIDGQISARLQGNAIFTLTAIL